MEGYKPVMKQRRKVELLEGKLWLVTGMHDITQAVA